MLRDKLNNPETRATMIFIIGSILILLSIIFKTVEKNSINNYYKGFNNLFYSSDLETDNKPSYLTINDIEDLKLCETNDICYYIVYSDTYSFIALMNNNNYKLLKKNNLKKNNIRINGITKKISNSQKYLLVEAYNKFYEDLEESQIDVYDFDTIYGINLLDTTKNTKKTVIKNNNSITIVPKVLFIIFLITGFICLYYSLKEQKKNTY